MRGHAVGNLLIVGLWELMGDHVRALDWVGRLLGAQGRVLPMAVTPIDITAEVRGLDPADPARTTTVRGQVEVATTDGDIVSVALDPPTRQACPEAVDAVLDADWVVLGPGSWFTSVIPHLMVPGLREALVDTAARLVVVLNLGAPGGGDPGVRTGGPPRGPLRARTRAQDPHGPGRPGQRGAPRRARAGGRVRRRGAGAGRRRRRRRHGPARPRPSRDGLRGDRVPRLSTPGGGEGD